VCRAALAVALAAALGPGLAPAQGPRVEPPDLRVEPPKTPVDYWNALEFELNTGQFEAAAAYLKGFLAANPTDKDFLAIERDRGMSAFLRLRTVQQWSANRDVEAEARKNAETVIERATAAVKRQLADPQRIARFIRNLGGTPEERSYAVRELQRSGAQAVPHLITALRQEQDPNQRAIILGVFPQLGADAVPPLLAAMDMPDPVTKVQLLTTALGGRRDLTLLANRAETNPLPTLFFLAASRRESDAVRRIAAELQTRILPVAPSRLPPAKVELTRAAERFYNHQANFINPQAVAVWRWEGDRVVSYTATVSQAEEYFGLRYARWALELDPSYEPAQVLFLSIATEKALERGGLEKPLAQTAPDVNDLLATVYPGALISTLDRALVDKRTAVALGVVRALGERAEVQAARPVGCRTVDQTLPPTACGPGGRVVRQEGCRPGVLVRALDYPDRRVQLAAADALLRMPGPPVHQASARVVEVLRRAVAADAETMLPAQGLRIMVAAFRPELAERMAQAVRSAGNEVVVTHTGRELMRRLKEAADIDAVILDSELPYPPLPDTLASLRYDVHLGLLPVRVVYQPTPPWSIITVTETRQPVTVQLTPEATASYNARQEARLNRLIEGYRQVAVVRGPLSQAVVQRELAPQEPAAPEGGSPPLTPEERKAQSVLAMDWLMRIASGCMHGYDVRPAERTMLQAVNVPELAKSAIAAAGYLPGRDPQIALANVVLDQTKPLDVRVQAAEDLVRHAQRHGTALGTQQIQSLMDLLPTLQDPTLRAKVAAAIGSLQGNSRQTGMRLQRYTPPPVQK
jgi:hypothetical protein